MLSGGNLLLGKPEYPEKTPPVRYGDHQPNSRAPETGIEPGSPSNTDDNDDDDDDDEMDDKDAAFVAAAAADDDDGDHKKFYVKSIQEFNEVSEVFSVMAGFAIRWKDESMTWNPANYGCAFQIMTSYDDVWVPGGRFINISYGFWTADSRLRCLHKTGGCLFMRLDECCQAKDA
ncbi:hypothetical protein DPMN_032602 [Dreissena polymorpha]|uniref:Neurotransmitter-gated ion-channel ligand-binding domain-containing protein n=1 Tax=Dreissena polymorpha TaxID=45954 RepID=A0A9D4M264_DREPO|nr:hypothetical protein DPMN_032602 [Dreissena polymorpha]